MAKKEPLVPRNLVNPETAPYLHKKVPFKFSGAKLEFFLSHALFSSHEIDGGTKFLLKTMAQHPDFPEGGSLLDMGCGVGVIGLSVKKVFPSLSVTLTDRDALALRISRENARLNGIGDVEYQGYLGVLPQDGRGWSCIASNIPAKVGEPVLRQMLQDMLSGLAPRGRAAVVVISALSSTLQTLLAAAAAEIVFQEEDRKYTVVHFRRLPGEAAPPAAAAAAAAADPAAAADLPAAEDTAADPANPVSAEAAASTAAGGGTAADLYGWGGEYIRGRTRFTFRSTGYIADCAWNLPEFDTLGYYTQLALQTTAGERITGKVLFGNPGQGHLPLFFAAAGQQVVPVLAGRDLLELSVSRHNLIRAGLAPPEIRHTALYAELTGQFGWVFFHLENIPETPWVQEFLDQMPAILTRKGRLVITGKSVYLSRILESAAGWKVISRRKSKGFSAVILVKPDFEG